MAKQLASGKWLGKRRTESSTEMKMFPTEEEAVEWEES